MAIILCIPWKKFFAAYIEKNLKCVKKLFCQKDNLKSKEKIFYSTETTCFVAHTENFLQHIKKINWIFNRK